MEVAVTGGSGFIGSHVVDHLIAAGHTVRVLDLKPPHRADVDWRPDDLRVPALAIEATRGCGAIMHLAAMANVNDVAAAPHDSIELNVSATGSLLEAARVNEISHFVFASTVWVYEASTETNVDESTPLSPDGAKHLYTAEKIAGELLVNSYNQLFGVPTTILRYGIPYGPRMREQLVIPIFIKKAMHGEALTVAGDGKQYRNFIYVEDLADAHVRVLDRHALGTFNLEGPMEIAIIEVAEAINARIPENGGIQRTEARSGDYQGRVVSRERAKAVLDWEPTTQFEAGLDRTLAWFVEQWAPQPQPA
ncbi:MAG: NAD-dependent epimerase/dehydratase family protein [bacterium]